MSDFKNIPKIPIQHPPMKPINYAEIKPETLKGAHNGVSGAVKIQRTQRKQECNDDAIRKTKEAFWKGFTQRAEQYGLIEKEGAFFAKSQQGVQKFKDYVKRHPWLNKKQQPATQEPPKPDKALATFGLQ